MQLSLHFILPMDSSPGFGSSPCDKNALFELAFALAPGVTPLAKPQRTNSLVHSTKGTRSLSTTVSSERVILKRSEKRSKIEMRNAKIVRISMFAFRIFLRSPQELHKKEYCGTELPFLGRITFQRLFHPPARGAFHLSLTVLSAIDLCICLALDGGPPGFGPDFTCPTLLRKSLPSLILSITGLSPSLAVRSRLVHLERENQISGSYNPQPKLSLGCSLFARHYSGNRVCFLFLCYVRCFSSQSNLPLRGTGAFPPVGFPIRKSSAGSACLAAYRSLSQLATSFIGMQSRGIHVMRMSNIS